MLKRTAARAAIFFSLLVLTLAVAPAAALTTGDPAPPLKISEWVKGEPVAELKKGEPYIVEFWATWCGPCRQTIPHLTKLQKQYEGRIKVIGISSGERKGMADVTPFVAKMGDKMDYRVAWDKGDMHREWMQASGQGGIPCAFVVDQSGRIAWIGHPLGGLDSVVEKVVAGTFDIAAEAQKQRDIKSAEAALQAAGKNNDAAGVLAAMDKLMVLDDVRHDQFALKKLEILLFVMKDYDQGYAWMTTLVDDTFANRHDILAGIAQAVAASPGLERRDLDLAERAATKARVLTKDADAKVLDVLARVVYDKGDIARAVEIQTKAVAAANAGEKAELKERLDRYSQALAKG